jgi:hypothetical protein
MSLDHDNQFDDEELDAYVDLDWIAVKSSDINAVAETLGLESCQQGSFEDLDESTNTFVFPAQSKSGWVIVIHEWEPRGSSEEYLDSIEQVLIPLSQRFGNAQSFASYENHIGYVHWVAAQNGELIRSFARASETSLSRDFGEMTEDEQFINWEDEEQSLGIREVIKIAKQWSVEPIYADHPGDLVGVVGHKSLEI